MTCRTCKWAMLRTEKTYHYNYEACQLGCLPMVPFSGIGSTVYSAVSMGRYGIGFELKKSYWNQSIKNLQSLEADREQGSLLQEAL